MGEPIGEYWYSPYKHGYFAVGNDDLLTRHDDRPAPISDEAGNIYILALYIPCLAAGSGVVGLFVYELFSAAGYVPGTESGLQIVGGVASAYAAIQLLYLSLVRLLLPTRDYGPMLLESISQLSALVLLPFVFNIEVAWPMEVMARYEPVMYLAIFGVIHGMTKLVSFFAYTSGKPASPIPAVFWAGLCAICVYSALNAFEAWSSDMESLRAVAPEEKASYRAGDTVADARRMAEGAALTYDLGPSDRLGLTLRWAPAPDNTPNLDDDPAVHVIVYFEGEERDRVSTEVDLNPDGWTELRLEPDDIPEGTTHCTIWWSAEDESPWQRITGIAPVATGNEELLMAGPYRHEMRFDETPPNIILIAVDGLGYEHMSISGYERDTTPGLDRLASTSAFQWFPAAYSPAPEGPAAVMTLLTGINPLRHGYRQGREGEIPSVIEPLASELTAARYTSVAFTEGQGSGRADLVYGSGVEQGFQLVDDGYAGAAFRGGEPGAGSAATLDKARRWIDDHGDLKFFLFVRLRELSEMVHREAYSDEFASGEGPMDARDVYDAALAHLDGQISAFIKHIRDYDTRKNTVVAVTGLYGMKFDRETGQPYTTLDEGSLHVPLLFYIPDRQRQNRDDLVAIEDVPASLLKLAGIEPSLLWNGRPFINGPNGNEPISVMSDPPILSIRTRQWRFTWAPHTDAVEQLYDARRLSPRTTPRNVASRYVSVVRRQKAVLQQYLDDYGEESQ